MSWILFLIGAHLIGGFPLKEVNEHCTHYLLVNKDDILLCHFLCFVVYFLLFLIIIGISILQVVLDLFSQHIVGIWKKK